VATLVADGKDRWRIPASGGMRVDGLVFASRRLMVKAQEDRAVDQVVNVAHLPGIVGASVAMPDIHWGYGFPIGGVAATDVEAGGVVSPGGVGFDIGCGVRLLRSELPWDEAAPRLADLVDQLAARIPRGVGGKGLRTLTEADMDAVLATGVRWALDRGIGSVADAEMHRTFNMGVGMVVICAPADADTVRYHFDSPGECYRVGRVVEGGREVVLV